jgi:hypothetical protein
MAGQQQAGAAVGDGRGRAAPVRLVTRLIASQAAVAGAIGMTFSRRHIPSIVATAAVVILLCGLAVAAHSGSHAAWVAALGVEGGYAVIGLLWFVTTRYLGGTLFALVIAGVLTHPAVARAFGSGPAPGPEGLADRPLGEPGPG